MGITLPIKKTPFSLGSGIFSKNKKYLYKNHSKNTKFVKKFTMQYNIISNFEIHFKILVLNSTPQRLTND